MEQLFTAEEALKKLKEGNAAYLTSLRNPGNISPEIRRETFENGQKPYAMVIACSDSRVIPEAIFSCGIGEIFTVRVAGNVVGEHELGCAEYALEHLGVPLIVVLGHTGCGAVTAAVHGEISGYVGALTGTIRRACGEERDPDKAAEINASAQAAVIREAFRDAVVKTAVYDTCSGNVNWLD